MLIHHDPDRFTTEIKGHTCSYHQMNPGKPYAGCTCSTSYGLVELASDEVAAIKRAKRVAHEERVLAEAAAIRARRRRRK